MIKVDASNLFPEKFVRENSISLDEAVKNNKRILVCGKVQSGKTNKIIEIVKKFCPSVFGVVIYLSGSKNDLLKQNSFRMRDSISSTHRLVILKNVTGFLSSNLGMALLVEPLIIASLKIPNKIAAISEFISIHSDVKTLIVDDEGDEMSYGNKTSEQISQVLSFKNVTYISITASPFKNLAMGEWDSYHVLSAGDDYKGIEQFNGNLQVVEETSHDYLIKPFIYWANVSVKLKKANSKILLNYDNEKAVHKEIKDFVLKLISFFSLEKNLADYFNDNGIGYDPRPICSFFANLGKDNVEIDNSDNKKQTKDFDSKNLILIGGANLSRGMTYKNIVVAVMVNSGVKPAASTLLQRARWLGYKDKKELETMKIFVRKEIKQGYEELQDLVNFVNNYDVTEKNYVSLVKAKHYRVIDPCK